MTFGVKYVKITLHHVCTISLNLIELQLSLAPWLLQEGGIADHVIIGEGIMEGFSACRKILPAVPSCTDLSCWHQFGMYLGVISYQFKSGVQAVDDDGIPAFK